ncbi:unnamed protein product [Cuscuta campestris]|uniref:BHLH domain-containing protein n=1 Tax=Cuscuta campestris TaxID=132261 RepID=A0A484K3K9_9ASTE|nr:unnamed protein product [Cuscuta campestris]
MDSVQGAEGRSTVCETTEPGGDAGHAHHQFGGVVAAPPESGFTALLELPPSQAVELLANSPSTKLPEIEHPRSLYPGFPPPPPPIFPSDLALIERASKFSPFAGNAPENLSYSGPKPYFVKQEPLGWDSTLISNQTANPKSTKRKERDIKVEDSGKKGKKSATNTSGNEADGSQYVHVRARRGQATNSHSLAERARREKINEKMKLLQELVPGCNKISGTAMVLDEIINHVQFLQRQVEFLSMSLAAVNSRISFNIENLFAAESENNFACMFPPSMCLEEQQDNGIRQPYQHQLHFDGFSQPVWSREDENSLLTYHSTNPDAHQSSLHGNHQLKMES